MSASFSICTKKASIQWTSEGLIIEIEDGASGNNIHNLELSQHKSDGEIYDTVESYAEHRKVCAKTIRNYLHLIPHSKVGGIRIPRKQADQALDAAHKLTGWRRRRRRKIKV